MARTFVAASSQYIDLGAVYDASVDFSVGLWVTRNAAGARHDLISKEMASADGYVLTIQFSDLVAFGVFNGGFPLVESTTSIGSGVTAHLLGVRDDAAGLLRMFVNGTEEATASAGGAPTASSDSLNIGRRPSGGGLNYADATIAEIGIWNAALNASEAAMLAKGLSPLLVRPQNLLAYLPLYGRFSDEPDLVGGITGTVTGATAGDHPKIYRPSRSMVAVAAVAGGVNLSPDAAQLALSTTAPSRFVQHLIAPASGGLTLSTAAPSISVGANVAVVPDAGQLALSTIAPSVLQSHLPSPTTGQLAFSTTAPTRMIAHDQSPAAAQVVFSLTAPSALQRHQPMPAAAQLTLTTAAPSLGNEINITVGVGQVAFSTTAPSRFVAHLLSPGAMDLTLSGEEPSALQDHRANPDAAQIAVSAAAPGVVTQHLPAVGPGTLTFSTTPPAVFQAHYVQPGAAQLVLTGFAPFIGVPVEYDVVRWATATVTYAGLKNVTVRAASWANVTVEPMS